MKKAIYYLAVMLIAIIMIPFFIVKGCSFIDKGNIQQQGSSIKIRVYMHTDKTVKEMELEEYLKGVVAGEMPAEFEGEALKAQAVAARTYALGRIKKIYSAKDGIHEDADICTDSTHCQAWTSKEKATKDWGLLSAYRNWNKISDAVDETRGMVITYDGNIANPLFHSNSGGKTENSEDVWDGVSVPYLRSVISNGEDSSKEYKKTVSVKIKDFKEKMKAEYKDIVFTNSDILGQIKIASRSEGGRVKEAVVGNKKIKGTDFRKIFSLNSSNFSIEKADESTLKITTIGNGHGVGMSQWGANNLAKNGGKYDEVLKYYYKGVELESIDKL